MHQVGFLTLECSAYLSRRIHRPDSANSKPALSQPRIVADFPLVPEEGCRAVPCCRQQAQLRFDDVIFPTAVLVEVMNQHYYRLGVCHVMSNKLTPPDRRRCGLPRPADPSTFIDFH